jgi:hypothetical protein
MDHLTDGGRNLTHRLCLPSHAPPLPRTSPRQHHTTPKRRWWRGRVYLLARRSNSKHSNISFLSESFFLRFLTKELLYGTFKCVRHTYVPHKPNFKIDCYTNIAITKYGRVSWLKWSNCSKWTFYINIDLMMYIIITIHNAKSFSYAFCNVNFDHIQSNNDDATHTIVVWRVEGWLRCVRPKWPM